MKRILAVSAIAIAACLGYNSAANAQATPNATSTHTGTVTATCGITATGGTLTPVAGSSVSFGSQSFPTELTSTGKFTTLCNTASTNMTVEKDSTVGVNPEYPTAQPAPTVTYDLSTTTTGIYATGLIGANIGINDSKNGATTHGFSATASALDVGVKVAAVSGKILQSSGANGYKVVLKATLFP